MSRHSLLARQFESSLGSGSTMAVAGGESAKVSPVCAYRTAQSVQPRYTGTKPTASGAKSSKLSATSTEAMKAKQFAVCLKNDGYEVSLERRKIYQVLPDPEAAKHRQVRVIDESGEDYLYPQNYFAPIELPQPIRRAVLAAV
jgi:hypothetical protein